MIPVGLWLVGLMNGNTDNTVRLGFPVPEASLLLDKEYYRAVEGWFQDALPMGRPMQRVNHWLDYHLFNTTSTKAVHIGTHGWLYPAKTVPGGDESADPDAAGRRLFLDLHAVEKIFAAAGRRFVFAAVPAKAAIYPEYLGTGNPQDAHSIYRTLIASQDRHPLFGFVDLETPLKKAKLSGADVYNKRSTLWTCAGAAAAAERILEAQKLSRPEAAARPSPACPPPDTILYRQILGDTPQEVRPTVSSHVSGPHAVQGPKAIIYGDAYLNQLMPFLTHAFKGMEVFDSSLETTFGGRMITTDGDIVFLESGGDHLRRLHLDLESLFAAAKDRFQGVVKRDIALETATPVSRCALDVTDSGLEIRSSGPEGFFALPALSGSTGSVFRMLKLTFSPGHPGSVSIRIHPSAGGAIRKTPGHGNRDLIVPLPFADRIAIQINPSEHPGVFTLESAQLLSFYGTAPAAFHAASRQSDAAGDIYSGITILPTEAPPEKTKVFSDTHAEGITAHPTDALPEISLTDITEGRIFQRQGKSADIAVTGTYSGVTGPVEARVISADDGAVMVPWTVVDDSPENGLFTGILHHVPQGGWYRLQVRSGLTPWTVEKGRNRWGVGMLVACIGQSNMREWFFTGNEHHPAGTLMLHRGGEWIPPGRTGDGALALGNRLTAVLKIPIGLLDYSVNGTGLTAKADWGKGFWLDTGPDSIYRSLIDGVNAAGGSVETVLWMQGEADAARGTVSREDYRQALERFVNDQIRADIRNGSSRSHLPFLMIPLVKRPTGGDRSCQWIRDAQMDALETIAECHLAAMSIDLENRGRQHLAPASYTTLGIRTAQTILYLLGKVSYHRGPFFRTVTRPSTRSIDIEIEHRGGTDFTPWTEITGFEVQVDGQPQPIASVSRKNGHIIRIELEEPVAEAIQVRYQHGAHPDTANPVRDNTDLRLPLEPFSIANP
ncbi:sialate O-acetylesterase [uncultured Desulfosarcina sp.]|uniref:sialate O-acetylesterase n=1 Tax=uncultured Desulfosarcina sp. TaxID=218289 RepID=UPI0037496E32